MKWKWLLYAGIGIASLVLISVLVLMIMGQRQSAGRITGVIIIDRPAEMIWPWLREPEHLKTWVSWLVEVRETPGSATGHRTWVMEDANNGGHRVEIDSDVVLQDPPRRLEVALQSTNMFAGTQAYTLSDLGNGRTKLEIAGQFRFTFWLAKLFEPLITPQAQAKLNQDLAHLKASVESVPAHL